jgi:membrane protein DedA with SNARE-associated domain
VSIEHLTELIITYRYWILLPLSFIEGPIVAFIAGTLAAGGYFNPYVLAVFFFARDIVVDTGCYLLGWFGGQTRAIKKILAKLGVTEDHLDEVRVLWNKHPGKTMFFSKLSYGVAAGFIVVAGMVEIPYAVFISYGALIAVLHYCALVFVGFFFGETFGGTLALIFERAPYVLAVAGVLTIAYYMFKRSMSDQLKKMEEEVEEELQNRE